MLFKISYNVKNTKSLDSPVFVLFVHLFFNYSISLLTVPPHFSLPFFLSPSPFPPMYALSDSFCGTQAYPNTTLMCHEPSTVAGLFGGR